MMLDLSLTLTVPENLKQALSERQLKSALTRSMQRAVLNVERGAKLNLTGRFLKVFTGRLRSSLTRTIEDTGATITGKVGTNVFYGEIHEKGGTFTYQRAFQARFKRVRGGRLGLATRRSPVIAESIPVTKSVTVVFPERPWLRTALAEAKTRIIEDFHAELRAALGGQK